MSFVVVAALGIALLVGGPIAAHLLRRGRARQHVFPPAALVSEARPAAQRHTRLEDRVLLLVRGLMIVVLAALGATPLVRCSRLSVQRNSGASVALAVVLDDSLSMRARVGGSSSTRFELAVKGARQLLDSMRSGDAITLVLAGHPARVALGGTTDLETADRLLDQMVPSDRGTDLAGALSLAHASLDRMPHTDRRVVVLSDLAVADLPSDTRPWWAPLQELRKPADDCGLTRAERRDRQIIVDVTCNKESAARGRAVRWTPARAPSDERTGQAALSGPPSGQDTAADRRSATLNLQMGTQTIVLDSNESGELDVSLTGRDVIPEDDKAPVASRPRAPSVAVVADPSLSVVTGGPSLIEQGLQALGEDTVVGPLPMLPEDAKALGDYAALIVDDIAGITPEARNALGTWLARGGVAAAFLGPRASLAPLGSTLEPFLSGAVRWEGAGAGGVKPQSVSWLGEAGASLSDLSPRGRLRFEGAVPEQGRIVASWQDDVPFAAERRVGQGLAVTFGLPCSVDLSDFALRPGFLAILDHIIQTGMRRGSGQSRVGAPWHFEGVTDIAIEGPGGPLPVRETSPIEPSSEGLARMAIPDLAGRYWVSSAAERRQQIVTIDPQEILQLPREPASSSGRAAFGRNETNVDTSPMMAWLLLALVGVELAIRMAGLGRSHGTGRASEVPRS